MCTFSVCFLRAYRRTNGTILLAAANVFENKYTKRHVSFSLRTRLLLTWPRKHMLYWGIRRPISVLTEARYVIISQTTSVNVRTVVHFDIVLFPTRMPRNSTQCVIDFPCCSLNETLFVFLMFPSVSNIISRPRNHSSCNNTNKIMQRIGPHDRITDNKKGWPHSTDGPS
jgi:hypothetical protein